LFGFSAIVGLFGLIFAKRAKLTHEQKHFLKNQISIKYPKFDADFKTIKKLKKFIRKNWQKSDGKILVFQLF
jgi:hypothetical protein